jgi:hypothetical protein
VAVIDPLAPSLAADQRECTQLKIGQQILQSNLNSAFSFNLFYCSKIFNANGNEKIGWQNGPSGPVILLVFGCRRSIPSVNINIRGPMSHFKSQIFVQTFFFQLPPSLFPSIWPIFPHFNLF